MKTINILLIEDKLPLEAGITAMLHTQAELIVLARIGDKDGLRDVKNLIFLPDIVLLYLSHGELMKNTGHTTFLKCKTPAARIVAMDVFPSYVDILKQGQAGSHGLILSNAPAEHWFSTIKTVTAGDNVLPSFLAKSLFAPIVTDAGTNENTLPKSTMQLTHSERQVINLIAEGLSNKEIAETLHIATYSVKSRIHNILKKLRLNTRLQISAYVRISEN